jgi:hypothetical protein
MQPPWMRTTQCLLATAADGDHAGHLPDYRADYHPAGVAAASAGRADASAKVQANPATRPVESK